jgi:hypothetical protein
MGKTKKRKYKRTPTNTRVFRCVKKVNKTKRIGEAIAICQSSTKQSYRTGRKLKKTRKKRKKKHKKK